jgi:two-component sensor histidine kinase/ABC-type amino acid transport substrate-binding protein
LVRTGLTAILLILSQAIFGQTLRFVADDDYLPVSGLRGGQPAGLYVDIARAVAAELHQPFSVEVENWSKAQSEVAEGTADVLYSVSFTDERLERFDFSIPLTRNEFVFFSTTGRHGLDTLDDLPGLKVGVTQAGLPRRLIEGRPQVTAVPYHTYGEAFDALSAGVIDTFAGDLWVGSYFIVQQGRQGITPSRHVFASLPAGFAVKKGNRELLERLNTAIARLQVKGTIDRILNRWDPEAVVIRTKGEVSGTVLVTTASVLGGGLVLTLGWAFLLTRENRQRREAEKGKESLLRELHHRTRNNMGVISALLELQAVTGDPALAASLRLTQNQIHAMALVHDRLYQTNELSRVGLRGYIEELNRHLASAYGLDGRRLALRLEADEAAVLIDTAVPLGLILNELVGNAIRHGFPPPRRGEIVVTVKTLAEGLEVAVSDTGVGFPPGFDPRADGGLGLQTVLKLAEEQLKARVSIASDNGVEIRMIFHEGYYEDRVRV